MSETQNNEVQENIATPKKSSTKAKSVKKTSTTTKATATKKTAATKKAATTKKSSTKAKSSSSADKKTVNVKNASTKVTTKTSTKSVAKTTKATKTKDVPLKKEKVTPATKKNVENTVVPLDDILDELMLEERPDAPTIIEQPIKKATRTKKKEEKPAVQTNQSATESFDEKFSQVVFKCCQQVVINPSSKIDDVCVYLKSTQDFFKLLKYKIKTEVSKEEFPKYTKAKVTNRIIEFIKSGRLEVVPVERCYTLIPPEEKLMVEGKLFVDYSVSDMYDMRYVVYKKKIITADNEEYAIYLPNQKLIHGDVIRAYLNKSTGVAYYQDMVTPNNLVLGRIMQMRGGYGISCDDQRLGENTFLFDSKEDVLDAKLGSIVICNIISRKDKDFKVRVREVLGDFERLDVQIQLAINRNNIPYEWNQKITKQLEGIADEVLDEDKKDRVDLRSIPLVTIDGEDARDFDDAVYCCKEQDGFRLIVAIADVSYYVRPGAPLDYEAFKRGTSVYFPNYVVPMLPEKLSNGLCSLNPHVDRLCMACDMRINKQGKIEEYSFYPAIMNSHARFTYTEVASILAGNKASSEEFAERTEDLNNLYSLYKVLKKARSARGAVEFESQEVRIVFDEQLNISDVVPVVRNDAHMLIEECMVAANICAARFVEDNKGDTMYRVHDRPTALKLQEFRAFISPYGYTLAGGDKPTSQDYADFVASVGKDNPNAEMLFTMMLRSMSLAEYTPENRGHFGLALSHYAHFTSPIRRYPDLQLHREIKALLGKNKTYKVSQMRNCGGKLYEYDELVSISENCNMTERRADRVTGDVVKVLKARFMVQFIGKTLVGVISNATNFGLFVNIERFKIDGLVHVSSLGNEYYVFEQSKNALVGSDSGRMYKIGDKVLVKITDVNVESGKVSMSLIKLANKVKPSELPTLEFTPKESILNNSVNEIIRSSMDKWNDREVLDIVNEVSGNIVAKKALQSFEVKKKHKVKKQK